MLSRIKVLQRSIPNDSAFLLANPKDIYYYSEFKWLVPAEREAFCLVTKNKAYIFHASFSPVKQRSDIVSFAGCYPNQVVSHVKKVLESDAFSTLFVDAENIFLHEYQEICSIDSLSLHNLDRTLIWQQRSIKDKIEIKAIKKAMSITQSAWEYVLELLKPGVTELEIKHKLERFCVVNGSETMAFPTIIAFGPHSALPHHQPTSTVLKNNTAVLVDFGAMYKQYCSDMTRTVWIGDSPDPQFTTIQEVVHDAYTAAHGILKNTPDCTAKMVDEEARNTIHAAGYGAQFIHTTGHGVGLDIHEPPSINWKNETKLQKNMVITIEPGIYIEGLFGYRHENTVIV